MLLVHCHHCGRRELRGIRSLERFENTPAGIVASIRCRGCGCLVDLGRRVVAAA